MISKIVDFFNKWCYNTYCMVWDILKGLYLLFIEPFIFLWKELKECWGSDRKVLFKVLASLYCIALLPLIGVIESVDNQEVEDRLGTNPLIVCVLLYSLIIWFAIGYALYNL